GLGRLTTATGPWGSGSYTYDALNNLLTRTLGSRVVEMEYNASNRLQRHRDTGDGHVWRNYAYDSRGNVTNNGTIGFSYDRAERPVSISGGASGSFTYDAHGRRVKQVTGGQTIYSVYSASGTLLYRDNATTGAATDYIRMGGRAIARVRGSTVEWTYADHLGSPAAAASQTGAILWREDHTPFGEARQAPAGNADNEGFTGHIADAASGLVYMQARYYDPVVGRFLSSDPVGFAQGGPAYFNRYAYALNDPVNLIDPDGREVVALNSTPFLGLSNSRWGGAEHQALIAGDDERGWTYVSKDGTIGGGAIGPSDYTIMQFATLSEAFASP
ncbi:RHS repeat-associated core domain-containing protein, partial [Synechocystis salina LEGE 06155]|nr:RHS repeat-associated core domain-containing protein [Synechocystis salina LEGE 06155]